MRLLLICSLFIILVSCGGGGGTLPETAKAPGEINLLGEWKMGLTIPDCPSQTYKRLYTYTATSTDSGLLQNLSESGDFPDFNSIAACSVITNQISTPLTPYHSNQLPIQFKEMLSLKFAWTYDGITIKEFTNKKVVVNRTVNFNNTGKRVWTYTLSRVPPLTEASDSILLSGVWDAQITMLGCSSSYTRVLRFNTATSDLNILVSLNTNGTFPETATAGRCSSLTNGTVHTLPTGFPATQTAAQFKQMMEIQTWDQVVINSWSQNTIILIRSIIGNIPSENAELSYTLTKP